MAFQLPKTKSSPAKTNRFGGNKNTFGGMGNYSFGQGMNESTGESQQKPPKKQGMSFGQGMNERSGASPLPSAPKGGVDMSAYRPSQAQSKNQPYSNYGPPSGGGSFVDRPWVGSGSRPVGGSNQRPTRPFDPGPNVQRPVRPFDPGPNVPVPQNPFGPGGEFFPGGPGRFAPPRTPSPPPGHRRKRNPQVEIDRMKRPGGKWDHPQNWAVRERLLKEKADYDANPFEPAHDVWHHAEYSPNMGYPGRPSPPRAPSPPSGAMPGYTFPGQPSPPNATSPLDGIRPFVPAPPQQPEPMPYPREFSPVAQPYQPNPLITDNVKADLARRQNMLNSMGPQQDLSDVYNQNYQAFMDRSYAIDPFGNRTSPQNAINQRDAFIARQQQEKAKLARIAGVYNAGQAPEIPEINRDYTDLWGQAGEMVQSGWTNPLLGLFNRSGRPNFRDLER